MAALDPALAEAVTGAFASSALVFGSVAAIGLLGVMDSLLGEDEDVPDEGAGDDGGDLFDDDAVAGGGDDEFAFDDGGDGGGEFDDFDVDGMEGEDGQGGGGGVPQLEGRVEEIEAELDSLSSTVSTVRTENEQIGESVEEVEENVRKLLEIYKMVTKGVNPFVEEGGGEAVPAGDGSLGLFDEEDEDAGDEDLGDDVADADAEEFFDEDLDDEGDELDEEFEDEADDLEEEMEDEPEEDSGGGKSFDDLREEYEGETEWSEDDELEAEDETTQPATGAPDTGADREKPYLSEIPGGYVTDLLVTEWIEFLVSESGPASVERAITYYENVEWIDRRAADQLRAFLSGHPATSAQDYAESGALSMDHHTTSLQYIARIDGDLHSDVLSPAREAYESAEEDVLRH